MSSFFNPKALSDVRKARNMTQLELSAASHITPTTISRVETGTQTPSSLTLRRLAAALGVTESEFFSDRDPFEGAPSEGYDPNSFYTRSIDKYGHARKRVIYFDPHIVDAIENALKSGKLAGTPLTSFEAVCRDALVHQMHRLEKLIDEPEIARAAELERKLSRIHLMAERGAKSEALVNAALNAIDEAIERRDWDLLSDMVEDYEQIAAGLNEPWSTRVFAVVIRGKKALERAEES